MFGIASLWYSANMKKVIFICRGNMFRSQMATAIYNDTVKDGSVAEGYGTAVQQEDREGRYLSSYPELALELQFMKEKGIDISDKQCRQVTPEALKGAPKIILMSEPEHVPDWLQNHPYEFWEVFNPTSLTPEIVENTYNLLREKISKLKV
jgi:protein-tyrosine-phosphatase